jgi:alpha-mannosidase
VFSFEGAYRYYLTKIHHPQLYERLKGYIASGNWAIAGSWVDAVDVNLPSPESLIRHALYGNGYFDREFGKKSIDIFLPDCFGFGYALPTIAAHCGLLGFSSQKFDLWGGWTSTPFPVGRWQGVDGSEIIAALKPGAYGDNQWNLRTEDGDWVYNNSGKEGNPKVWATYDYMGVGDIGGGPDGGAVGGLLNRMNQNDGQEIKVVSAASDSLFRDLLTRIIHKFC